jgi:ketosteroid isomerase-like protein
MRKETGMVINLNSGGIDKMREVISLPRWPEGSSTAMRAELVREEAELRDQLIACGCAYDAHDLDSVMDNFADDCVVASPRGRRVGVDAIREHYLSLFRDWQSMRHLRLNVVIRFSSAHEAYRCYYYHVFLASADRMLSHIGTDVQRLSKISGRWKIVERYITRDMSQEVAPHVGVV